MRFRPFLAGLVLCAATLVSAQERGFLVKKELFNAVAGEYSGEAALENVKGITRFHRVQASPGYDQAAQWVMERLRAYGIQDIELEKFPSDGKTLYQTYRSPLAWTIRSAELSVEEPFVERLCRYSDTPMCLSTLSNGGDWRGELVEVGSGTREEDYAGKEVRGKIVLATGYAGVVHRMAVIERSALGVVIYPRPDDRPEYPDLVRYNGLWPPAAEKDRVTFGFQVSRRQADRLRGQLAAGKKVILHARVDAQIHPGFLEVVNAWLRPAKDQKDARPDQEILLTAHLDHPQWSANDNASGSASLIEIARTLKTLVEQGKIPPLRRTIHFLWVPEHFGTVAWLTKHREISQRAIAALNLDMVGENLYETNSLLRITRTPESLPSFLNELVENIAEQVEDANLVSPNGSRNLFHWRMTPYDPGSDHDMFNDGGVRVPSLMFGHWPDWTHHTNEDTVDKLDSTTLKRVGVLAAAATVWLANAGDEGAMRLFPLTKAAANYHSLRRGGAFIVARSVKPGKPPPALKELTPEMRRELQSRHRRNFFLNEPGRRALQSLEVLMSEQGRARLAEMVEPELDPPTVRSFFADKELSPGMARVPRRQFIGPIADGPSSLWFRQAMGADYAWWREQAAKVSRFDLIVYEACNFADGRRMLAEIEESVLAEYGELPQGLIEGIFGRLAKIGLVELTEERKQPQINTDKHR